MQSATLEAGHWWARPRDGAHVGQWIETYQSSLQARHRTQLVDVLRGIQPETLLEVGCHCGPNLVRFAEEFPGLQMHGVDINQQAIAAGQAWIEQKGLKGRIQLSAGRVPAVTAALPSNSCDVVLSCYALAYIAPADLDAVLYELGRLATKAIVLAEPMVTQGSARESRALSGYAEWAHNYQQASKWLNTWRGTTIAIVPIEPPVDRLNGIVVATRASSA